MGKAKKRNFKSCINQGGAMGALPNNLSRNEAILFVMNKLKESDFGAQTKDMISLFGITAEELSEAGATYEELIALKSVLN